MLLWLSRSDVIVPYCWKIQLFLVFCCNLHSLSTGLPFTACCYVHEIIPIAVVAARIDDEGRDKNEDWERRRLQSIVSKTDFDELDQRNRERRRKR